MAFVIAITCVLVVALACFARAVLENRIDAVVAHDRMRMRECGLILGECHPCLVCGEPTDELRPFEFGDAQESFAPFTAEEDEGFVPCCAHHRNRIVGQHEPVPTVNADGEPEWVFAFKVYEEEGRSDAE